MMFWSMVVNMLIFLFVMTGIFYLMNSWNDRNSKSKELSLEQLSGYYAGDDSAVRILKKRYAKGEITKEEFITMKEEIQNS